MVGRWSRKTAATDIHGQSPSGEASISSEVDGADGDPVVHDGGGAVTAVEPETLCAGRRTLRLTDPAGCQKLTANDM
jgi:hypothetical protein